MDLINFTFPTESEPDIAIEKLLKALDLQNLQFMTSQTFSELETPPYKVDAVTVTGTPDFVKFKSWRERFSEKQLEKELWDAADVTGCTIEQHRDVWKLLCCFLEY